jgi:hypothetical protein
MFIPVTYFFYPETANRTLEDIDRFFETHPPLLVHRNKLATQLHRPDVFIEADEKIAREEDAARTRADEEKAGVIVERLEDPDEKGSKDSA